MNSELLIELVRDRKCLYDMSEKKYSDYAYKENLWREISEILKQPVQDCKKTWTNLRDSFRRAIKNNETKSGQKTKFIKKWKYAEEMQFLKTHLKERDSISNVDYVSDENEKSSDSDNNTEINVDSSNDEINTSTGRSTDHNQMLHSAKKPRNKKNSFPKKKTKTSNSPTESASASLMQYILAKKTEEETQEDKKEDAMDQFFSSMCTTVKQFSPYHQHIAKTKIFGIISEIELEHIQQQHKHPTSNILSPQSHVNSQLQQSTIDYLGSSPIHHVQQQGSSNQLYMNTQHQELQPHAELYIEDTLSTTGNFYQRFQPNDTVKKL